MMAQAPTARPALGAPGGRARAGRAPAPPGPALHRFGRRGARGRSCPGGHRRVAGPGRPARGGHPRQRSDHQRGHERRRRDPDARHPLQRDPVPGRDSRRVGARRLLGDRRIRVRTQSVACCSPPPWRPSPATTAPRRAEPCSTRLPSLPVPPRGSGSVRRGPRAGTVNREPPEVHRPRRRIGRLPPGRPARHRLPWPGHARRRLAGRRRARRQGPGGPLPPHVLVGDKEANRPGRQRARHLWSKRMKVIVNDRRPTGRPSPPRTTTWGLHRSTTWGRRRTTTWGWSRVSRTRAPSPPPRGGGRA